MGFAHFVAERDKINTLLRGLSRLDATHSRLARILRRRLIRQTKGRANQYSFSAATIAHTQNNKTRIPDVNQGLFEITRQTA